MKIFSDKLLARSEIPKELTNVSPFRSMGILLGDWAVIFASIFVAIKYVHWSTFVLAQVFVASRQHALFLFMHEASHYNVSSQRKWNDFLSNYFAAWLLGFSTDSYRVRHWLHHRYLSTEKDPDWVRKQGVSNWQFPQTPAKFWKFAVLHSFGLGVIEVIGAIRAVGPSKSDLPQVIPYYLLLAAGITLGGFWKEVAIYWVLPYCTTMLFLHRVRNVAEHFGLPEANSLSMTRNMTGSPIEEFFFGPHNANLHLLHHHYPYIPCQHLPAAHKHFQAACPHYRDNAYENWGYFLPTGRSVYRDLVPSVSGESNSEQKKKSA